jgi:hypothetical protein
MQWLDGGDWEDIDLAGLQAGGFKLSISYSHPAQLTWTVCAPQHTAPIPRLAFVRMWDPDFADPDDIDFSPTNPLFEGFVEDVKPGSSSNRVEYTAIDPTFRAAKVVTIMDAPYVAGPPPVPATDSIPRLVYNAKVDADPDYAVEVGHDGTVGQIIAGVLEYTDEALKALHAAPAASFAYDSDELDALTFEPQEKLVFESESPRSALDRLIRYEPRFRLLWQPGTRKWRCPNIITAPTVTLTLNSRTANYPVMSLEIQPSFENAATALKIYGPKRTDLEEFRWDLGGGSNTLAPVGSPVVLETYIDSGGSHDVESYAVWQIVDAGKRRGGKLLPVEYAMQVSDYQIVPVRVPVLLCSWDGGTTWNGAFGVVMNYQTGTASFVAGLMPYVKKTNAAGDGIIPGSTQKIFAPNAVRLIWAPFGEPLSIRVPESGFEGTAYTVAGLEYEAKEYDEALAVGYEYGIPVTTSTRLAKFAVLAQAKLDVRKDIAFPGGATLDGLDWSFCRLAKRVNFAGDDGSGGTTTTGWETINAVVTDVEYDFEEQITSLTFSSDWLALLGDDSARLKERLKIRALQQRALYHDTFTWMTWTNMMGKSLSQIVGLTTTETFEYYDAETGELG